MQSVIHYVSSLFGYETEQGPEPLSPGRYFIIGPSGSGKTVLTQHLAGQLIDKAESEGTMDISVRTVHGRKGFLAIRPMIDSWLLSPNRPKLRCVTVEDTRLHLCNHRLSKHHFDEEAGQLLQDIMMNARVVHMHFFLTQQCYNQYNPIVRANVDGLFLFKGISDSDLRLILSAYIPNNELFTTYDEFSRVYKDVTNQSPYSCLKIDCRPNSLSWSHFNAQ